MGVNLVPCIYSDLEPGDKFWFPTVNRGCLYEKLDNGYRGREGKVKPHVLGYTMVIRRIYGIEN